MTTKKTTESVEQDNKPEASELHPEYSVYKMYQTYLEDQQRHILAYWTATLNNLWWWKK